MIAGSGVTTAVPYGRDLGARDALRVLPELLASPPDRLDEIYLALRRRCLGEEES